MTELEQTVMARIQALDRRLTKTREELAALRGAVGKSHGRTWDLRLVMLQALYENGGSAHRAAAKIGRHHSTFYRHRDRDRLFQDCWRWVARKSHEYGYHRPAWNEFWPHRLPPDLQERLRIQGLAE